ncbi:hypothetical protein LTR70_008916 [Exophiala xenobiotica]|uniref:Uncharacterized protein n=1 Tax=Lithohypha guttulata TaxID=1690604 RepID=A0ABR0JZD4_9EURO|nr:hypothetical protein LTR24_008634 [Lithohypha guttulata]KAK5311239.1 hypothetical protein LTR70_008916 [Exophiala xenobiotica]
MNVISFSDNIEDHRPFIIRRVAKPGSSIKNASIVVSCKCAEFKLENVYTPFCKLEDLAVVVGCTTHEALKKAMILDLTKNTSITDDSKYEASSS